MFLYSVPSEYVLLLRHDDVVVLALESDTENRLHCTLFVQCTESVPVYVKKTSFQTLEW